MAGSACVVDLDARGLVVRDQSGVNRHVAFAYAAEHLDYGYALTGHAAQGVTVDRTFVLLPDQGALQEWGYVACSRARLQTRLYLADHELLERETPLREPDQSSPPERAARSLQRTAAESLALDQRRQRGDTILNFYAQQQEQLERHRERTEKDLAAAQREREHLHWWNRDRRPALEAKIADHQKTLDRADAKDEQLRRDAGRRSQILALVRERDEALGLRPEPPSRGPAVKLERESRGLEL
jgi:hypothetical protein